MRYCIFRVFVGRTRCGRGPSVRGPGTFGYQVPLLLAGVGFRSIRRQFKLQRLRHTCACEGLEGLVVSLDGGLAFQQVVLHISKAAECVPNSKN